MELLAVDTETTGLNPYRAGVEIVVISWWGDQTKGVSRVDRFPPEVRAKLVNPKIAKLFFNAKFDITMLKKAGIQVKGPVIDTSIAARMCWPDERQLTLKHFSRKFLDFNYIEEVQLKAWIRDNKYDKKKGYGGIPDHILFPYAQKDAEATYRLYFILKEYLDKYELWDTFRLEMKLLPIVAKMESHGVAVSHIRASSLLKRSRQRISELAEQLHELAGGEFNPNSPQQLAKVLYDEQNRPDLFTKGGLPSTSRLALLKLKGEIATTVLKYRKITKASQTYLRNVINGSPDGIFRVSFNQCGARTGRFSSSGYEIKGQLQNIPRTGRGVIGHIRHIFNPSPNYGFGFIDYEQIEMRLCAHFTKDEHMLEAIRKGEDLHSMTCIRVFNKSEQDKDWKKFRYIAKTLNFAVVYGVGAEKFTNSVYESTNGEIDIPLAEAAEYINKYKEQHYKLMGLFSAVEEEVALTGGVRNPYGRFMPVEMDKPYTGVNYLIQSTAADVIKRAMIACHQRMRGTQSRMLMQVHDELIFEIHKEDGLDLLKDLGKIMENNEFSVPLTVSISKGKSWGEKEAV